MYFGVDSDIFSSSQVAESSQKMNKRNPKTGPVNQVN